jgi:hypothetical protein
MSLVTRLGGNKQAHSYLDGSKYLETTPCNVYSSKTRTKFEPYLNPMGKFEYGLVRKMYVCVI